MADEKNHGIWTNRPAVQKAFDADPQRAYNVVTHALLLTGRDKELVPIIESGLCPEPTKEAVRGELEALKDRLAEYGVDTAEVDKKLAELG